MITLYCVTCRVNDKMYVGITSETPIKRWARHIVSSRRPKYKFHLAIAKYGPSEFCMENLFSYCDQRSAKDAEIALIHALDLTRVGYNASPGGCLNAMAGKKHSAASRLNMSRAHIGRRHTEATKNKIGSAGRGRKRPDLAARNRLGLLKGRPISDDHRRNISEGRTRRFIFGAGALSCL